MRRGASTPTDETRWTLGAWLTLAAALLFVALNVAQIIYRLTVPSLGWAGPDPETLNEATPYIELDFNAVGVPSAIKPGDIVQAVGGIAASQIVGDPYSFSRPSFWRVGGDIKLTVLRDGQKLSFEAPLVHWTIPAWWRDNFGGFSGIVEWLVTLLLFGVGAFTFIKRPGNLSARFLFAFGLANLSGTLGDSIHDYIGLYFDPTAGLAKLFFSNIVFAYLIAPSFLGYALTFPRPKSLIQRRPGWLLLPYLIGSVTIVLIFIDIQLATIGFYLTFAMMLLGVAALIHSGFTMRDAISRAQLRWAVGGVATGVAVFMLNFASNVQPPYREIILFVASLGAPIIGLSLAIAILRYRLFDIDFIIRKTLQYALLTALLALVYFGSVILLQRLVEKITGEQSPVVIVISTLGIAALSGLLRVRVQNFIDRRFFRRKYNAEKALLNFAKVASDEVDIQRLTEAMLGVVEETMQPEGVSMWIKTRGGKP